jgi:hypothetical protein
MLRAQQEFETWLELHTAIEKRAEYIPGNSALVAAALVLAKAINDFNELNVEAKLRDID